MENEPDHENVEQTLCGRTTEEDLNKSFNLEASLSKFSYIDLDKELELKNDLIDDKEFDIPQVDTPPTLESILNETDDEDESFVLEDPTLLNIDTIDSHSYDTSSVASSDSGDRTNLKRKKKLPDSFSLHGSVMRHSLLKGISAQIASAADKVDAGLPTAIAVSSLIAVGTSHGLALIFGKECHLDYHGTHYVDQVGLRQFCLCLCLSSAWIVGMCHHAQWWIYFCDLGFMSS